MYNGLIAQLLADKIYLNPARMHAASCHYDLTAETFGAVAVVADARCRTGEIAAKTDGVGRAGSISDSGDAAVHIRDNFIHTGHNDDMGGALNQTGDAVAVAVDIDELAVQ